MSGAPKRYIGCSRARRNLSWRSVVNRFSGPGKEEREETEAGLLQSPARLEAFTMASSSSVQMRLAHPVIQRFFEISLYFMLFTGFAALAGTGKLDGISVLIGLFALVVKGFLLIRRSAVLIPERWTNYLTLGYLFFFAFDYFLVSRSFLAAIVHMVLFAAMVKVFSVHRDRDFDYLAILSFGMVLTASVLLAVMTFVSMEMRRAWISSESNLPVRTGKAGDLRRVPAALAGACTALVLTIVAGTVVLFFLVPRKATGGYLSGFAARSGLSTGFSEDVRLGEIGEIQQSNEVVMHVKFAPGTRVPAELFWRGIALANFDGRRWTADRDQEAIIPSDNGVLPAISHLPRFAAGGERIAYQVSLEPFGARVFFVIPQALVICGRYRMIAVNLSNDTIFNADSLRGITDYGVVSQIPPPMPRGAGNGDGPPADSRYVKLPPYLDAQIPALAKRITRDERTNFEKASAIARYLSTTYQYTLQLPLVPTKDPIANFLFQRKAGHCEYFASSMAVMLRTLGIPSRIVNGFRGGVYNDLTGSYVVRARDAHSWVEAYFPDYGWYTFDPTPGGAQPQASGVNRAVLYLDAMREFWHEWVVNYDSAHQASLAISAARRGRSEFDRLKDWSLSVYQRSVRRASAVSDSIQKHVEAWIWWTSAALVGLFAFLAGPKFYRAIRFLQIARKPALEPHSAATIWYRRALRLLSKRGIRKSVTQTPQEFLRAIPGKDVRRQVEQFTVHYERARFGDSASDAERLPELYRELEDEVKK